MIFTWQYLLILIVAVWLYYWLFNNKPLLFLNTVSLAILLWWSIPSALLAVFLTFLTYFLSQKQNSFYNYLGIVIHLIVLLFLNNTLLWIGADTALNHWKLLGISYFSLQNIALLLSKKRAPSLNQLFLGNTFFSKFLAGPILSVQEIGSLQPIFQQKRHNLAEGTQRILFGLAKKLILADRLTVISNNIFDSSNTTNSGFSILFGSVIFTFQMYLDFSAYSDIAIGSAKLFGINFKENFNLPFKAKTLTEYWRRTHISLIDWLSENLYFPIVYRLRKHPILSVTSGIMITFLVSGIWHGQYVGYFIWGGINGLYLTLEYLGRKKLKIQQQGKIGILITFFAVSISNFFFRAKSMDNISNQINNLIHHNFFPSNWMVEFVAIIGNGGHFLQQYNLLETALLIVLFFSFESKLESFSRQQRFSFLYLTLTSLVIVFFGHFNAGNEFIYVQF